MKIVHVGLGVHGRRWFEAADRFSGAQSVAAVDPEPAARQWVTKKTPRIPVYETVEKAVGEVRADVALVAGQPADRVKPAIEALRAGLGVIVLPPAAADVSGARELLRVAGEVSRPVVSAACCRLGSAYTQLAALIRKGWIGSVTHASLISQSRFPADDPLGQLEYSQLLAQGVEELAAAEMVLGARPASVICRTEAPPWSPYRHGSRTELFLEFEGQVHLHYQGKLAPDAGEQEIWIEGQKGTLWSDGQRVWWRKRGWPRFVPFPKARHNSPELALRGDLKRAMKTSEVPDRVRQDLLTPVALVEAAIRSDRDRCPVLIADLLDGNSVLNTSTSLRASGAAL